MFGALGAIGAGRGFDPLLLSCEINVTQTVAEASGLRMFDEMTVEWVYGVKGVEGFGTFAVWRFVTGLIGGQGNGCRAKLLINFLGTSSSHGLFNEVRGTEFSLYEPWWGIEEFRLLSTDPGGEDAACFGQFPEEFDRPRVFDRSLAGIVETAIVDQVAALEGDLAGCEVIWPTP